jgi:hypothetical protein
VLLNFFRAHREITPVTANERIIREFCDEQKIPVTAENCEIGLLVEGHRLALQPAEKYTRQANLQESRIVPQRPSLQAPVPVVLPLTRKEILAMSPEQIRQITRRGREYEAELNRILAVRAN